MAVGLIGTGILGSCIAQKLLLSGYDVIVYNRTRAKAQFLVSSGARLGDTPGHVFKAAEVTLLILKDFSSIDDIFSRADLAVLKGRDIIQMGTISPAESRLLQKTVEASGGGYMECPVLGSRPEVISGRLILMFGGTQAQFERRQALLSCLGPGVSLVGDVGQAAALKLAFNQLIASLACSFSLSLGMVARSKVDVNLFMQILRKSSLYAKTFDKKLDRMLGREYGDPNFPVRHLLKDVILVLKEAQELGLKTDHFEGVKTVLEKAMADKLSEGDYSAVYDAVNPPGGGSHEGP